MAYGQEGFPPHSRINCSSMLRLPAGTQRGQSPRSWYCSLCLGSAFLPSLPSKFLGILRTQFNCHLLLEVLPDPSGRRSHSHKSSCNLDCCTLGHFSQLPHTGQLKRASMVAQTIKNLPAMQETWVQSLGCEDPLEKERAAKSKRNVFRRAEVQNQGFSQGRPSWRLKGQCLPRPSPSAMLLATCTVSPTPVP